MGAPVTTNSYQLKKPCAARFEAEQAPSSVSPTGTPTGKGKEDEAQSGRPPLSRPCLPPPPSYRSLATPPPSRPSLAATPPLHSGPAASSSRFRVPRGAVNVKWSPTEEIISCDFRWSFRDFIEAFDDLTDEGFVAGMGYQYKIGDRGSEVILTAEDEYSVFLGRVKKAPKGARALLRPTSSVRSLLLQYSTLR